MVQTVRWLPLALVGALGLTGFLLAGADEKQAVKSEEPKALSLEDAYKKARCDGKYQMLLTQIKVPKDYEKHKDFHEQGLQSVKEYAGKQDLPKGYWVYVYPYWYIWRDKTATQKIARSYGPEQVIGEPNVPEAADSPNAWASLGADDRDEWLLCEYANFIEPKSVEIYENLAPGAVVKVTAFKLDGSEVELWKGRDPTSVDEQKGISIIPIKAPFKTNRLKIYIDSMSVPYWNEIDAVGIRDKDNKTHWVVACEASSTYARDIDAVVPVTGVNGKELLEKVESLETEVRELKQMMKEMRDLLKDLKDKK